MNRWIIPFTGFTESVARPTGIERVWRALRDLKAPDVCIITPRAWDDDVDGLARFILRNTEGPARVMVVAYSWGAGVGFVSFARAAWDLGIDIDVAVLCDPVYRSRVLPAWLPLNVRSVLPVLRPRIEIAPSVRRVRWVRQDYDLPRAHDLFAADPARTGIADPKVLAAAHTYIDETLIFREMALEEGRRFVA